MKLLVAGDRERAVCDRDGRVTVTYGYRDVPFSDGKGIARRILAGACDVCGRAIAIPPQSTPAIRAARRGRDVPLEAVLPAAYVDALDLACYRIDPDVTTEFRKRLLMYFLHRSAASTARARRVAAAFRKAEEMFAGDASGGERRRISMKISADMSDELDALAASVHLSKTDLIKGFVGQMADEIIRPAKPAGLAALRTLVRVASC